MYCHTDQCITVQTAVYKLQTDQYTTVQTKQYITTVQMEQCITANRFVYNLCKQSSEQLDKKHEVRDPNFAFELCVVNLVTWYLCPCKRAYSRRIDQ